MKQSIIALAVSLRARPYTFTQTPSTWPITPDEVVTVIGTPLSLSTQNIEQSVSAASNIDADFGDQLATLPGVDTETAQSPDLFSMRTLW